MVSDLNQHFGGSTDLAKKKHGSADLHTPIHPPPKDKTLFYMYIVVNALSCTYLAHRHVTETDEIRELVILYILCIFFISSQAPVVVRVNPYWI